MTSALHKLLSLTGKTPEDFRKGSQVSKIFRRTGVKDSAELKRILALPRREWSKDDEGFNELHENMQEWLRMPAGTMILRPVQAKALAELHDFGGLFGPQRVGSGKSLVSFLAPVVLEAKRPLLFLPAKLRDKTIKEIAKYQKHFRIRPISILSYEMLSRENGQKLLQEINPDLIIADECFPGNTLVRTDVGDIPIRDIVDNGKATYVLSRNDQGILQWRKVIRRLRRDASTLLRITHEHGSFVCTPPHKIWTEKGYVRASALSNGDSLCFLSRKNIGGEAGEKHSSVLQSVMLDESSNGESRSSCGDQLFPPQEGSSCLCGMPSRLRSHAGEQEQILRTFVLSDMADARESALQGTLREDRESDVRETHRCQKTGHSEANERKQSDQKPGYDREDCSLIEGSYFLEQRRQWAVHQTANSSVTTSDGIFDPHSGRDRSLSTTVLQGRSGNPATEDSHRGGRKHSQNEEVAIPGSQEDGSARVSRVVSVEVLERRSAEKHLRSDDEDSRVYDLEVEGNHNYFADGVLVSNCHRLKSTRAACTRKVADYMKEKPETRFVALSGTITKRSIRDYVHIVYWCLPYSAPLPKTQYDLEEWSSALDEKIEDMQRLGIGALDQLCLPEDKVRIHQIGEDKALALVRQAFQRRLTETPGVVATSDSLLGTSLQVIAVQPKLGHEMDQSFTKLRGEWVTPDDHPITDGFQLWRHARELACGFYYRWNPRPPEEWLNARRNWARFVRDTLSKHIPGLYSEMLVAKECAKGDFPNDEYLAWRAIRDTFEPNQEAVWVSDATLHFAADWLKKNDGICWVEHIAFGKRLAEMTGLSYYAAGGLDAKKRMIEDGKGPCIASVMANSEGRNLQQWSKSLVISCHPSGALFEQLLGRLHRDGQEADEVCYEIMMACKEQMDGFYQALADARYLQDSLGSPQKLLYADLVLDIKDATGPRWR